MLTSINRSFTTVGSFLPAGVFTYWNFDGNANDQTGIYNALSGGVTDITYVTGRNAASGQAASFNGTTSLIEIPNGDVLENSSDFSISFWMKCDTVGQHDQWVLGLSAWEGFRLNTTAIMGLMVHRPNMAGASLPLSTVFHLAVPNHRIYGTMDQVQQKTSTTDGRDMSSQRILRPAVV